MWVSLTMQQGTSPLYIASQEGHLEVVQVLLEYGASVNLVNDVSWVFFYTGLLLPVMCTLPVLRIIIISYQLVIC